MPKHRIVTRSRHHIACACGWSLTIEPRVYLHGWQRFKHLRDSFLFHAKEETEKAANHKETTAE